MRRQISDFSAALLLASMIFASCGSQTAAPAGADTVGAGIQVQAETVTETEAEDTALRDAVPELDFGGETFRSIQQGPQTYNFTASELNGEVINDAIYNQLRTVSERFNISFADVISKSFDQVSGDVKKSVTAGEDAYDLCLSQFFQSSSDAVAGYMYDWNNIPYIDFSQPCYTKSIQEASVGSRLYMLESDLCLSYTAQTWMLLYNKTKAEQYSLPDLYEMVNGGKWTYDELIALSAALYTDLNGDSSRDDDDFYGFAGMQGGCMLAAFFYGGGGEIASIAPSGELVQHIGDEHSIDVLVKMNRLFIQSEGTIRKNDSLSATRKTLFPHGNIMFMPSLVGDLLWDEYRSLEDDFGVLPIPKYDEQQSEYYTVVDGGADIMTIPATAQNTEMIGAVVEALSVLSYNDLLPKYMSSALEQKGTRDESSIRMLRSILDSRLINFSYMFDGSKGWVMTLPSIIKDDGKIVSTIEKELEGKKKSYQSIIDSLTEEG